MTRPNNTIYNLKWTDTGVLYSHPHSHKNAFRLDEAMRIAGFEEVTVVNAETGEELWVGGAAEREAPRPDGSSRAADLRREQDERGSWSPSPGYQGS